MATAHETKQDIQRIADEIRLRIHLAGMEAKDTWAAMEPKIAEFERAVAKLAGKASDELDKVAAGLHRELKNLQTRVAG